MKLTFRAPLCSYAFICLALSLIVNTAGAQIRITTPNFYRWKNGNNNNNKPNKADPPRNSNKLTDQEKADGWQLLFDGQTLNSWHTYNQTILDGKWEVNNGTIHLLDRDKGGLGTSHDLVTNDNFGDFDFKAEWKVAAQTNSGILIHVQEGGYKAPYETGPEMQVLDNQGNPNGQKPAGRAGALYGLLPCLPDNARPPGQWNEVEILCQGGVLKFFQNGSNVVTVTLWDDAWSRLVAGSEMSKYPDYGAFRSGRIDLQDMAGEVWFTNIKIKRLDANSTAATTPAGNTTATSSTATTTAAPVQSNRVMNASSPDLSGMWVGQQTNGNLIMYYELGLVKTGENTYTGFDSCRWVRNSNNAPLNVKGDPPHSKKVFVAKYINGVLECAELGNMQNSNWGVSTELFKLANNNGTVRLVNAANQQPNRHFDLRLSGQPFPDEYLPYLVSDSTLQIDHIAFVNSHEQGSLRFNDKGRFVISVRNNALFNFSGMNVAITADDNGSPTGLRDYEKLKHIGVNISKSGNTELSLPVATDFSVPSGTLHFNISLFSGHQVFAQKDIVINTEAFFRTDKVTLPEAGIARLKAVYGYFGSPTYAPVAGPLGNPALAGDKLAAMWKAVFTFKGYGGYKQDEPQATALAKQAFAQVESEARQGNAEALYLMYFACLMGLEGNGASSYAEHFLQMAVDAGFGPAIYDGGLLAEGKGNYETAFSDFNRCFDMGLRKAAANIGALYDAGHSVGQDMDAAFSWYQKGVSFGDPAAMVDLAMVYATGFGDNPPNIDKALELAERAATLNYTPGMMFIGNVYAGGRQGKAQNFPLAIKWFRQAADLGDAAGMLKLGLAYLADNIQGVTKDEPSAFYWIKRSAEGGNPDAMIVLSKMYGDGMATGKDVIRARYWYNQAVQRGAAKAERKDLEAAQDDAANFWQNADFSPSTVYVNRYTNEVVGDSGPDILGGMLGGIFGAMMQRYANVQEQINGLEFIQQKNGYRIYGGTISSGFISKLNLKQGETITVRAYGIISTGMFSGSANADGLGNNWPEYRIVPSIPCSAVMAQIQGGSWQFIGQKATFTATKDGPLVFALNAIDYMQYKGYFDLVIREPMN